jgi:hypothetical protein
MAYYWNERNIDRQLNNRQLLQPVLPLESVRNTEHIGCITGRHLASWYTQTAAVRSSQPQSLEGLLILEQKICETG